MKKVILPLVLMAIGYAIFFFIFEKKKAPKVQLTSKTEPLFKEKTTGKIKESFEAKEEMEPEEAVEFEPLKEKSEPPSSGAGERKYIGADFKPIDQPPNSIVYENSVNPDWENLLIKEFFDGDRPDGNIEIKRLDSFVYMRGGMGLYVEKVSVNVIAPKEMAGTFYAYVNSGTGEIIHAWEGEEDTPSDEVSMPSEEISTPDVENSAMDIPESTIEEGIEFTEEEMSSAPSEDTFYPEYN